MPDVLIWIALGGVMVTLFSRRRASCCAMGRFGFAGRRGTLEHGGFGPGGSGRRSFGRGGHPRVGATLDPSGERSAGNREASYAGLHAGPDAHANQAARPPTLEEKEAHLRARYVAGDLSVDEYERGLDELYRRGA